MQQHKQTISYTTGRPVGNFNIALNSSDVVTLTYDCFVSKPFHSCLSLMCHFVLNCSIQTSNMLIMWPHLRLYDIQWLWHSKWTKLSHNFVRPFICKLPYIHCHSIMWPHSDLKSTTSDTPKISHLSIKFRLSGASCLVVTCMHSRDREREMERLTLGIHNMASYRKAA